MKWKIYSKYKGRSYKIIEIRDSDKFDIYIHPSNSVYFSREVLKNLKEGERIEVQYSDLGRRVIDHFSVHSSGQRHIKISPELPPTEVILGHDLKNIITAVPLITMVVSVNQSNQENPTGRWFGYCLPDDTDYLIIDMVAIPNNSELGIGFNFSISNKQKSRESFDEKTLEMKNCKIKIFTRTTNHKLSFIPCNVIFHQNEGKTLTITRVENRKILAEVSNLEVVNIVT